MGNRTRIEIEGVEELRHMLRHVLPNEARNILRQVNFGIAKQLAEVMEKRVKKRTGKLAHTIKAVRRRSKDFVHISDVRGGHAAPYGFMLEFGTSRTRAQPFIVPSVEEMRPELREIYREQFGKQIEKLARRKAKAAKK